MRFLIIKGSKYMLVRRECHEKQVTNAKGKNDEAEGETTTSEVMGIIPL